MHRSVLSSKVQATGPHCLKFIRFARPWLISCRQMSAAFCMLRTELLFFIAPSHKRFFNQIRPCPLADSTHHDELVPFIQPVVVFRRIGGLSRSVE